MLVELVIIHPRDRLLPHRVVVDNERLARIRGIQPGLSVLVGVDELVRRAEYACLLRKVYVLSVAVSGSQSSRSGSMPSPEYFTGLPAK